MKTNFSTSDIVLAAVLRISGQELISISREGNRGIFNFGDVSDQILRDYDLGNCRVEPVAFNTTIKTLTGAVKRI